MKLTSLYSKYVPYKFRRKRNRNKTVAVTGSAGLIGSTLIKKIKKRGFNVVGIDMPHPDL